MYPRYCVDFGTFAGKRIRRTYKTLELAKQACRVDIRFQVCGGCSVAKVNEFWNECMKISNDLKLQSNADLLQLLRSYVYEVKELDRNTHMPWEKVCDTCRNIFDARAALLTRYGLTLNDLDARGMYMHPIFGHTYNINIATCHVKRCHSCHQFKQNKHKMLDKKTLFFAQVSKITQTNKEKVT
jgi:hypothetical protein